MQLAMSNMSHTLQLAKPCMPYILQLAKLGTYTPYIWQCQAWHIHLTVGNARHVIHLIADNIRHGMCTYSWQCHACHTHYSWQCHTGHSFYSWQCQVCHTPYSWQQQAWCVYLQLAKPGMSYTLQLTTAGMASVPYSWQCQHVRHLTDDNIGHHIYLTARNIKQPYIHYSSQDPTHHTHYSCQHQHAIHLTVTNIRQVTHLTVGNIQHAIILTADKPMNTTHTKCLTTDYSPCTAWALHTHHILIQSSLLMLTLQTPYSWQCSLHYSTGTWNALRLKHHTKVIIFHLQTVLEQHSLQTNIKPCTSKQRS